MLAQDLRRDCLQVKSLGTAACPPYHIALVIGGLRFLQPSKDSNSRSDEKSCHPVLSRHSRLSNLQAPNTWTISTLQVDPPQSV